MTKELIISANVHEKKVCVVEDGIVTEFYVERRDENQGVVGNLYKGRVMKVLPGMQSAFVDIGLERDAFLYVSDFTEFMEEEDEIDFKESPEEQRTAAPRVEDRSRRSDRRRPEPAPQTRRPEHQRIKEEEDSDQPAMLEDVVEQLAEIADESLIPPPAPDEELEEADIETKTKAETDEEVQEARVTRLDETDEAQETEEEPSEEEVSKEVASPVEEKPAKSRSRRTRTAKAETSAEKPRSSRSRKKTQEPEEEAEKPKTARRSRKKKAETEAPEETAAPEAEKSKTAKPTARRSSRKRSTKTEVESASNKKIEEAKPSKPESQFQRITDEDLIADAGDMLKDAIVQEKIIDQIHTSEYRTTAFEPEPEPEWRVGSLRSKMPATSDYMRIVDETGENKESRNQQGAKEEEVSPMRHISSALPEGLLDQALANSSGEAAPAGDETASESEAGQETEGVRASADSTAEATTGTESDQSEEEGEAEVRTRGSRADFAVRRGGRGRRRRRDTPPSTAPEEGEEKSAPPAEAAPPAPEVAEVPKSNPPRRPDPRHRPPRQEGGRRPDPPQQMRRPDRGAPTISDLLHEGQEILVQIAKEPIAKKGARITSHIALPGRYLVYMPTVNHVGVSRKIASDMERIRLKRVVSGLRDRESASGGFIARTACAGHTEQELHDDMKYLLRTWADVRKKAERNKAPDLVHRDLDLVQRILRDQLSEEFGAIRIDNEIEYARIVEFVNRIQPKLVKRVKLYTGSQPILEKYGVQPEIDKAVKPRVWLRSGGYIVINQTEALVAIDVNTGKFVGKSDKLEDTITRTNLEAAKEIVRQIRLRDLGGIIVIDFIDMDERKNRQRVMTALQAELQTDRAPSKILSINDFGLVAITRKRVKQSLERTLCTPCPYCQGGGMVKSPQTMCFEILEQAKAMSKEITGSSDVVLRVSPDVADALRSSEREVLEEIEAYFATPLSIEADPHLHQEQYDFAIL